jgi:hypothetical protein
VVARTDDPAAGNGNVPDWYHKHWRPVNHTSYPVQVYESFMAARQAERYEAGYDVCSELASHASYDASVSLRIDHLTGGLIKVLVFVAPRFDTAYYYSVASSHQQRFGSDYS